MPVAGQVAIIGTASTPFGVQHDRSYLDLLHEAASGAIADAGLTLDDIGAAWLGTASPEIIALEGDSGTSLTQALPGFAPRPVTRVAAYCATGMEAVRTAATAIAAGEHDYVLAAGAEKMRDVTPRGSLVARTANLTHPTLAKGRSGPGGFALVANRYFDRYGRSTDDTAAVAVKNHEHATRNPIAQYAAPITAEDVHRSPAVADPLRLLDCTPTTDGSAAVVLTSVARARERGLPYTVLDGIGMAVVDGYYQGLFQEDNDFLGFKATRQAAAMAYAQAGIERPREQLDVVECHDCFTITEIVDYEDLGLTPPGTGWELLQSGATSFGGDIPVNLSGGLLACGHPIGATGVRMVKEISDQLTGRAGERQVRDAQRGLCHTLGGPGVLSCVMVLSRGS
jgi:acetyl-CoA C-acetyltransferase